MIRYVDELERYVAGFDTGHLDLEIRVGRQVSSFGDYPILLRKMWPDIGTGEEGPVMLNQLVPLPIEEEMLKRQVEHWVIQLFIHEINECLTHNGQFVTDPHPKGNS